MWNDIIKVHVRYGHSKSHDLVIREIQDVKNILPMWIERNNTTKWSEGLEFIQRIKNRKLQQEINCSPYKDSLCYYESGNCQRSFAT